MDLLVNGQNYTVPDEPERPLLWVLRDELKLRGTRFSCQGGTCGSCTVQIDGVARRSCQTPVSALAGRAVTTIEALAGHPLQAAWDAAEMPPCGRCRPGVTVMAAALLARTPHPSAAEVDAALLDHQCWCYRASQLRGIILAAAATLTA
jgi:isoquinoline 1-oxidoreductase alpha subunit